MKWVFLLLFIVLLGYNISDELKKDKDE